MSTAASPCYVKEVLVDYLCIEAGAGLSSIHFQESLFGVIELARISMQMRSRRSESCYIQAGLWSDGSRTFRKDSFRECEIVEVRTRGGTAAGLPRYRFR